MVVLTEEMLIARSRQSNLKAITKLNCWGSQLTDVSILRRMTNVVVLSLSVNSITTLADLQYCKNLQELFLRKNKIQDLNEVVYLKDLEHLKHLWLGENPCTNVEGYRLNVIRTLPKLEKLDEFPVEQAELQKALKYGRVLVHPEQIGEYYSDPDEEYEPEYSQEPQDNTPSPDESPVEQPMRNSNSPDPNTQYQREREYVPNNTTNETEQHYNDVNRESLKDPDMSKVKYEEKPDIPQRPLQLGVIHRSRTLSQEGHYSAENANSNNCPVEDGYRAQPVYNNNSRNFQPNVKSEAEFECNNDWKRRSCQSSCCIQGNQKKPNERRTTNVLNAVLCLVKELDYPNLEVVQMAVKCRMEELAEM